MDFTIRGVWTSYLSWRVSASREQLSEKACAWIRSLCNTRISFGGKLHLGLVDVNILLKKYIYDSFAPTKRSFRGPGGVARGLDSVSWAQISGLCCLQGGSRGLPWHPVAPRGLPWYPLVSAFNTL